MPICSAKDNELCPLIKLGDDGLLQLHTADDNAVDWPRDVTIKALQNKYFKIRCQLICRVPRFYVSDMLQ